MTDKDIIELYFSRNEKAISETEKKFGAYLIKTAYNVLSDTEDSKEAVNDTYLKTWNIIPPKKPERFLAFLSKITRELSIDIYRKKHTQKRIMSEYSLAFDEIGECVPSNSSPEEETEAKILAEKINEFVHGLPEEQRNIFICRYFYFDSVSDIASYYSLSQSNVKTTLFRLRNKLKEFLETEGLE